LQLRNTLTVKLGLYKLARQLTLKNARSICKKS